MDELYCVVERYTNDNDNIYTNVLSEPLPLDEATQMIPEFEASKPGDNYWYDVWDVPTLQERGYLT